MKFIEIYTSVIEVLCKHLEVTEYIVNDIALCDRFCEIVRSSNEFVSEEEWEFVESQLTQAGGTNWKIEGMIDLLQECSSPVREFFVENFQNKILLYADHIALDLYIWQESTGIEIEQRRLERVAMFNLLHERGHSSQTLEFFLQDRTPDKFESEEQYNTIPAEIAANEYAFSHLDEYYPETN